MKVLMFGWEFPPVISGGLGTACYGLTKGLASHGVETTFVIPTLKGMHRETHVNLVGADEITERSIKNISILKIDSLLVPYLGSQEYESRKSRIEQAAVLKFADLSGKYGPDLMSEIARYSAIGGILGQEEEFDVIHAHDWLTFMAGLEAKKQSGKPLVVHVHATEFDRSGEHMNKDVYDIEKKGMDGADLVVAVSHYTKDILVTRYGIPADKIRVVHNAVEQKRTLERMHVHKALDEKIVLFLGRITFQKGPEYFIEAARRVIERVPDVRFVMAGTGDMFPRMVEMAARCRIGKHFHFTGFLQGQDVEKIYAMSDLYVMPSVSEPFGIAPLEAMLYEIPVIVSTQSGVAEILDHAVKIDFWDVEKLANEIATLLTDEQRVKDIVEKNTEQLKSIKWEIAAEKLISIYDELRDCGSDREN